MLGEDSDGIIGVDVVGCRNKRHRSHDVFDQGCGALNIQHEAHIAVGHDANQAVILIHNRQPRYAVATAKVIDFLNGCERSGCYRVGDHAGFRALDQVNFAGLAIERKIAVQNTDAALAGHSNGHAGLGHGVHRR